MRASLLRSPQWPTGLGASVAGLEPLTELIRAHVFAVARLHADNTTVPVLAKGKTRTRRLWAYVRDDLPFGGRDPPAVAYFYFSDRRGEPPQTHLKNWSGIPAGRCLWWVERALCRSAASGTDPRSLLLGACKARVLQACRCRAQGPRCLHRDLADRARSGQTQRCDL